MTDFDEIYRAYFGNVYAYALSLCGNAAQAEELTQETFFRALRHIDEFRGDCKLWVWLCQIVKNLWRTECRKESRRGEMPDEEPAEEAASLEDTFADRESARELHRRLHRMDEPYREIFMLRVLGELPFAQIAELFGRSEGWARVMFYRAKQKLREESK